jgi:hypothetical protein
MLSTVNILPLAQWVMKSLLRSLFTAIPPRNGEKQGNMPQLMRISPRNTE